MGKNKKGKTTTEFIMDSDSIRELYGFVLAGLLTQKIIEEREAMIVEKVVYMVHKILTNPKVLEQTLDMMEQLRDGEES